jgi:hypothetical protein
VTLAGDAARAYVDVHLMRITHKMHYVERGIM